MTKSVGRQVVGGILRQIVGGLLLFAGLLIGLLMWGLTNLRTGIMTGTVIALVGAVFITSVVVSMSRASKRFAGQALGGVIMLYGLLAGLFVGALAESRRIGLVVGAAICLIGLIVIVVNAILARRALRRTVDEFAAEFVETWPATGSDPGAESPLGRRAGRPPYDGPPSRW